MSETLKEVVAKLGTARDMIAMLNATVGEKFTEKGLSKKVEENYLALIKGIDGLLFGGTSSPTDTFSMYAGETWDELKEWKDLKEVMSLTSYKDRKLAQTNIDLLSEKLQNTIVYNPQSYFNTYFYTNTIGISENRAKIFSKSFAPTTNAFQDWFGDSTLKDENGEPIIFYHGAKQDVFVRFDFDVFPGMYFAEKKSYAEFFAGSKGHLYEVYLNVVNPIDLRLFGVEKISYDEFVGYIELKYGYTLTHSTMLKALSDSQKGVWVWQYLRMSPDWIKEIADGGFFDGFRFFENNPSHKINNKDTVTPAVMVFRPEQIKLTQGNLTFASSSKDIRFGLGGFVIGSLIGGYVGYKIGRSRPQKTGFETEKKLAKKTQDAFRRKRGFIKRGWREKGGNADSLAGFESWQNSPDFQSAIRELNEKDIEYANWSDSDIWKWWLEKQNSE